MGIDQPYHHVTKEKFKEFLKSLYDRPGWAGKLRVKTWEKNQGEINGRKLWHKTQSYYHEDESENILMHASLYDAPDMDTYTIYEEGPVMVFPWQARDFERNCFVNGGGDYPATPEELKQYTLLPIVDAEGYLMCYAPDHLAEGIVELLNLGMEAKEEKMTKEYWERYDREEKEKAERRQRGDSTV